MIPIAEKNGDAISAYPFFNYKVWTGDILVCPTCDAKIVYGFSDNPVAVHHEEDFDEKVARIKQGEYIEVFERGSYRYDKKVLQ